MRLGHHPFPAGGSPDAVREIRVAAQRLALLPALLLLGGLWAAPSQAEAPRQDAAIQQVLRKAQGALRQLSEEKAKLEEENAALQKEKAELADKAGKLEAQLKLLEPLPAEVERLKAAVQALQAANAGLQSQLGSERDKEAKLRAKLKEIITQAKKIQGDNQLLVEAVKEREQWIAQCGQKNGGLAELQGELIQRYESKGFLEVLKDAEPLTGIGHVQTENTVQDFQFKLQDLQATPFASQLPAAQEEAARKGQAPATQAEDEDEE